MKTGHHIKLINVKILFYIKLLQEIMTYASQDILSLIYYQLIKLCL